MSRTLEALTRHFIKELPETSPIELPFHLENFCRELDEEYSVQLAKLGLAEATLEIYSAGYDDQGRAARDTLRQIREGSI